MSPVKLHRGTFEEDKAFMESVSIAKTDPKYGKFLLKNGQHLVRTVSGMMVQSHCKPTFSCHGQCDKDLSYMHNFSGHLHYNLTETCRRDCFW